jgi:type I restriction enzyme R subunit
MGEQNQKDFIKLYSAILACRNILVTLMSLLTMRSFHCAIFRIITVCTLICTMSSARVQSSEKENINDDLVFEMELIKQVEINIDHILVLIKKYHEDHKRTVNY